jgi:hypothetical protein
MTALQPRVVLVGHADVNVNHAEFVNASRHVVRFNLYPSSERNTGSRTTVLAWVNLGATGRDARSRQAWRTWPSRPGRKQLIEFGARTGICLTRAELGFLQGRLNIPAGSEVAGEVRTPVAGAKMEAP